MKRQKIRRLIDGKCIVLTEFNNGYYVSVYGDIYSFWDMGINSKIDMNNIPRKLKLNYNKYTGYYMVVLGRKHNKVGYNVHTIICRVYYGKKPKGKECSHLDGNKLNNKKKNLIYENHYNNTKRMIKHGTDTIGIKNKRAKVNKNQLYKIRLLLKQGKSGRYIANIYNFNEQIISKIKLKQSYKYD